VFGFAGAGVGGRGGGFGWELDYLISQLVRRDPVTLLPLRGENWLTINTGYTYTAKKIRFMYSQI
jgi:hypothetical protein